MSATDAQRIAQGQADLASALAGDLNAAKSLYDGRIHSIAFSRNICNKAWIVIVAQRLDIARQVVAAMGVQPGDAPLPPEVAPPSPGGPVLLPSPPAARLPVIGSIGPAPALPVTGAGMITPAAQPHPIGFAPTTPLMLFPPAPIPGGLTVTGIAPGVIVPVNIGADGGVITGPPALGYTPSAPSTAPLDLVSAGVTPVPTGATPAVAPDNKNIILLLAAAALLFIWLDSKRKGQ